MINTLKYFLINLKYLHIIIAVRVLRRALNKDYSFWVSYQSAIAMSLYDTAVIHIKESSISKAHLHLICNVAADNFMKMWLR